MDETTGEGGEDCLQIDGKQLRITNYKLRSDSYRIKFEKN